jgi:pSer/pThr/pTyr-binding forkhead associated (FHA) protein/uncharacterized coiled-coil protein SlyX
MEQSCPVAEAVVELPSSAPQIRVSAGVGSAGQKTWNLRRPVTLLGSKRPAHIVLHDRGVCAAHCAIINTGTDVLLFDLHTTGGTFRGKEQVELTALQDGDIIKLGESTVQVAIRLPACGPDDSGSGMEYSDPTSMINPATITLLHTDTRWTIEKAVALIGRNDHAAVRLDHNDVSARHALLFRFGREAAIYDLGSRAGIWVNGQRREVSVVADGDRVTVGPFGLQLEIQQRAGALGAAISEPPCDAAAVSNQVSGQTDAQVVTPGAAPKELKNEEAPPALNPLGIIADSARGGAASNEEQCDPLQTNIAEAWERMNQWRAQLRHDAAAISERQISLSEREAQIEARDAAFRGQLHDITRFNEQLAEREKQMAQMAAQAQAQADALGAVQKEFLDKQIESQKKEEELHRREQALTQRWSRMQSTVCPHCQKPITLGAS